MAAIRKEDHVVLKWKREDHAVLKERRGPCGSDGVNRRGPCGFGVNRKDHAVLKERREDHVVLGCFFLPRSLGSRRDFAGKKRGERTLAGGP